MKPYRIWQKRYPFALFWLFIAFMVTLLAAWWTHIVVCLKAEAWVILIAGIVVPPIGVVHGISIWFGVLP